MSKDEIRSSVYKTFKEEYAAYKAMNLREENEESYLHEHVETETGLKSKIEILVEKIKKSKHVVFYTGAGISTSAGLPDYRGPKGVWTELEKGIDTKGLTSEDLQSTQPTKTHHWISKVINNNTNFKYCMSTNIDNLHRRSGLHRKMSEDQSEDVTLSELHGNMFIIECSHCNKLFEVPTAIETNEQNSLIHDIDLPCTECTNKTLRDIVVSFHSSHKDVPSMEGEHDRAWVHCIKSDLLIVFGSSLSVPTACDLIDVVAENGGDVVIVNKQRTPKDHFASLTIRHSCDVVVELLNELGL